MSKGVLFLGLYFLGASLIAAFGLLCCFWRDTAIKWTRAWTYLMRIQRPDVDWEFLDRTLVPPRIVGFLMFLGGLWLALLPLPSLLGTASAPSAGVGKPSPIPHHPDLPLLVFALCILAVSVYMAIDPIGLWCLFTFQKRERYPRRYKRGAAAIAMTVLFGLASGLLLYEALLR